MCLSPSLIIGSIVRVYYDEETFDEGEIIAITDEFIHVDFYDWIERWNSQADFSLIDLYFEVKQVWMPISKGEIIVDFRLTNKDKLLLRDILF